MKFVCHVIQSGVRKCRLTARGGGGGGGGRDENAKKRGPNRTVSATSFKVGSENAN
jgi:hypothetical protein